jgi:hypothetical protein
MHAIDIILIAVVVILAVWAAARSWSNRGKCGDDCSVCRHKCQKPR